MKTIEKSVLIWFSAQEMFNLVVDVRSYPDFLPWCESTEVLEEAPDSMVARIGMALGGLHKSFTTRNVHTMNQQVQLQLVDGPFKHLQGEWNFIPVGEERACRVELKLSYSFDSMFGALVGPIFDRIAANLVDAFVKRAEVIYRS